MWADVLIYQPTEHKQNTRVFGMLRHVCKSVRQIEIRNTHNFDCNAAHVALILQVVGRIRLSAPDALGVNMRLPRN